MTGAARFLAALLLCGAASGQSSPAPSATFEGFHQTAFEAGTLIEFPDGTYCTAVRVRVPAALLAQGSGALHLHLDERNLRTRELRQGDDPLLVATTAEPLGLFRGDDQILTLERDGALDPLAEWHLRRSALPYLKVSHSGDASPAPDVRIDAPPGGAFTFFGEPPASAKVEGSVLGPGEYTIRIDGRAVERDVTRSDWGFSSDVPLGGASEIEVFVAGAQGSTLRMFLPVRH